MAPYPILLLLAATCLAAAQVPQNGDVQPTPDEAYILCLLNADRADPRPGDMAVDHLIRRDEMPNSKRCRTFWVPSAPKGSAPPLVFDAQLISAARTIAAGTAQAEYKQPLDWAEPLKTAGYTPDDKGLALLGRDFPSLFHAYAAALVHIVEERAPRPGANERPVFAGRLALDPAWRQAGIAVVKSGKTWSVAIVLGQGAAKRYAGGMVYADRNRDDHYAVGEGQAGVTVTCGSASCTTAASGAWWMALPTAEQSEVVFTGQGFTATRTISSGADNLAIDWSLPDPADIRVVDRLIADAGKTFPNDDARRKALAALMAGTRMARLDDTRQERATALLEPIVDEYEQLLRQASAALSDAPADFKRRVAEWRGRWKGSFSKLFKEMEMLNGMRQAMTEVQTAPADQQAKKAGPLLKLVDKAMATTNDPVFLELLRTWKDVLETILADAINPPKW